MFLQAENLALSNTIKNFENFTKFRLRRGYTQSQTCINLLLVFNINLLPANFGNELQIFIIPYDVFSRHQPLQNAN